MNETLKIKNPELKASFESALVILDTGIAHLEASLSAPVLDGTPFLLCSRKANTTGFDTVMVYGHWVPLNADIPQMGWRSVQAMDNFMTGAFMKSEASCARTMQAAAPIAAKHGNFLFKMHRREFETLRLAEARQSRETFVTMLARLA